MLKYKIKTVENAVLEKSKADVEKPTLCHDPAMIEDELKPEIDVLNKLVKLLSTTKMNLEKMSKENAELKTSNGTLKTKLLGVTARYLLIQSSLKIIIFLNFTLSRITTK